MSEAQTKTTEMSSRLEVFPTFKDFESMTQGWTQAAKIRYLRSLQTEEDRGAIAKYLGIKYQWVRNVLTQEVKTPKAPKTVVREAIAADFGM
jgi:hypothetical protein